METREIEKKIRRDLNNAVCLIGIIPLLIFFFLIVQRSSSFSIFVGSGGYMVLAAIAVFFIGIIAGRRIIVGLVNQLIRVNKEIVHMQQELVEQKRTDAVVQTVITLSHEINTPLMTLAGSLELAERDLKDGDSVDLAGRLGLMRNQCGVITDVLKKMSKLTHPTSTSALTSTPCSTEMIDMERSG